MAYSMPREYDLGVPLDDLLRGNRSGRQRSSAATRATSPAWPPSRRRSYLWIGCSDSRVPANEVTGTDPGEVFVHRNVANLVVHPTSTACRCCSTPSTCSASSSVVVCGHLGCGGVRAALDRERHGLIDNWLRHVQDVAHEHSDLLAAHAGGRRAPICSAA